MQTPVHVMAFSHSMCKAGFKVLNDIAQACQRKFQAHEVLPALMRGGVLIQGDDIRAIAMNKFRDCLYDTRLIFAFDEQCRCISKARNLFAL